MNVEKALFLFGLNEIDKKEIRKRYLRKCREYHPDKHMNATDEERKEYTRKFNELQEAYICLNDDEHTAHMVNDIFKKNVFSFVVKLIRQIKQYEFREEHIFSILELLDDESLRYIYHIIQRHGEHGILENITKWIENKISVNGVLELESREKRENTVCEIQRIELCPTLYELFERRLYFLKNDEISYFIPLWHRYLYMASTEITIEPKLENDDVVNNDYKVYHLYLDDNNDLHIYVVVYIEYIFNKQEFIFDVYMGVPNTYKKISIPVSDITMKKDQVIILKKEGIPRINKENIYDDRESADVFVFLQLVI